MTAPPAGKRVVALVHRIFTETGIKPGGIDYVTTFLETNGLEVIFIEHPLSGTHKSRIKRGESIHYYHLPFAGVPRWLAEFAFNISKLLSYGKVDLIIAVDPLNFISAFAVHLIRKTPVQFHAVDFSEHRFGIKTLDACYRLIYYFAITHATFVTYVSKNMRGVIDARVKDPTKVHFLPNSPEYERTPRVNPEKKSSSELVYTKSYISDTEVTMLLDLVSMLIERFPTLTMHIIGQVSASAQAETQLRQLENSVVLHGLVDYQTNIQLMSISYIGLAWYENVKSFEKYADSLKIREYAAAGLPVVCNRNISTALEAYEKGLLLLCNNVGELAEALANLMTTPELYSKMRSAALNWAKENDKTKLLNSLYRSTGLV